MLSIKPFYQTRWNLFFLLFSIHFAPITDQSRKRTNCDFRQLWIERESSLFKPMLKHCQSKCQINLIDSGNVTTTLTNVQSFCCFVFHCLICRKSDFALFFFTSYCPIVHVCNVTSKKKCLIDKSFSRSVIQKRKWQVDYLILKYTSEMILFSVSYIV